MGLSKTEVSDEVLPWYKQGWPWFIFSIPAASVVLGFNMLYLALQTNNSLVVDDYYKQGKSISQYAERDRSAASLKLTAQVHSGNEGIKLQLTQLSDAEPLHYPEVLNLRWVHVTQSHKDGATELRYFGDGWYFDSQSRLPGTGRWRVHVEPAMIPANDNTFSKDSNWRLVSERITLFQVLDFSIDYRT